MCINHDCLSFSLFLWPVKGKGNTNVLKILGLYFVFLQKNKLVNEQQIKLFIIVCQQNKSKNKTIYYFLFLFYVNIFLISLIFLEHLACHSLCGRG